MNKKIISFLLIILVAGLPGCKQKNGQCYGLRPLTSYIDYQETKQGITLRVKQLSQDDCKFLMGDRAKFLWKKRRRRKPIVTIQLSLTNDVNNLIALKPTDIDLKLVEYKRVARHLHRNSFMQLFGQLFAGAVITVAVAAGSIFALSATGMLVVLAGSMKAILPATILGGIGILAPPAFLVIGGPILSTAKLTQSARQNAAVRQGLKTHNLRQALLVEPHQTVDTLIFVEKQNYRRNFTITIRDPKHPLKTIEFPVLLHHHAE